MLFRRQLDLDLAELRPELFIFRMAAQELKSSERFKSILQIIRAIGNKLNMSTSRGDAYGFKLDALLKVRFNCSPESWLASSICLVTRNETGETECHLPYFAPLPSASYKSTREESDSLLGGNAPSRSSGTK